MDPDDPRRRIPRTDRLLSRPAIAEAAGSIGHRRTTELIHRTQAAARTGEIAPDDVEQVIVAALHTATASSLRPVINATGVIVHTNLGRAPLCANASAAVTAASGYTDVEFDVATGTRTRRGAGARAALLEACPPAADALVVNNCAAALVLAATALAGNAEVLISRGELIEIGAGFRIGELLASTGARLHEVGSTNRTHPRDYAAAAGADTGFVLKVHPSNYRITGYTADASIGDLAEICHARDLPLVVDLGSGLLRPDSVLPDEPDAAAALASGADIVVASGDKLLGGPQAGLVLGRTDLIAGLASHPLARAMRADKLALAALQGTLAADTTPVADALHAEPDVLHRRTDALATAVGAGTVVTHDGRAGGGGGAEVPLAGWALQLPEWAATRLRADSPPIVTRVRDGACLLDLRCVPETADATVADAVRAVLRDG